MVTLTKTGILNLEPGSSSRFLSKTSILTGASFAAMFFLGVGTAIVGAASRNIGLSPSQIGLLVSIQNIGFIFAVVSIGTLADTKDKTRLLLVSSLILAVSFYVFYLREPFNLNLLIMLVIGFGIGGYEGAADPLLLDLHHRRQSLFISINHFFVTFGEMVIALYLIYLQMDWRQGMVQSAAAVLVLAVVFGLSKLPPKPGGIESLNFRMKFLRNQRPVFILFILAACAVGIELALVGMITSFLMEFQGFDQVTSKIGLVVFLLGVASGRLILGFLARTSQILNFILVLFALTAIILGLLFFLSPGSTTTYVLLFLAGATISVIFPLVITLTGLKYQNMAGTALGIIKLGIPAGGIITPLLIAVITQMISFQAALLVFPMVAVLAFLLTYFNRRLLLVESSLVV